MRRGQSWLWAAVAAALLVPTVALAQYVFYTDTNQPSPALRRCGPNGTGAASRTLPANTLPEGIAYDALHNTLYWAEASFSGARIRTTDPGLGAGTTILAGLRSLRGIAVDGAGGWIYWTASDQAGGATINRAHLDGMGAQVLFLLPGFNPRQIAIDPVAGKVYWTEFEIDAIARCNLDGSLGEFFTFLAPGTRPYGIAVNPVTHELWWSEYRTGFVQSLVLPPAPATVVQAAVRPAASDLRARSTALVAAARERTTPFGSAAGGFGGLVNPTYLTLDVAGQQLYVTQAGAGVTALRRANMDGSGLITLPVPQTSFGGVAWHGGSLLDVPGDGPPPAVAVAMSLSAENPAHGSATMEFALPAEGEVALDVLDTAGRRVASLAGGRHAAGVHRLSWTGATAGGRAAPGMYLLRLEAGGRTLTKRFAYLR